MARWHLYFFATSFFTPFRLGRFQNPPVEALLDSAVVNVGKELPRFSFLEEATDEALSASDPKRKKLSSSLAFPHHEIATAFVHTRDRRPRAQAAVAESPKHAGKGRSLKKPSNDARVKKFQSIEQQIILVMAITEVRPSEKGAPSCQPVSTDSIPTVESTYYQILKGRTKGEYEREVELGPPYNHHEHQPLLAHLKSKSKNWADSLVAFKEKAELDKHPEVHALKNYLTFLAYEKKGRLRKGGAVLRGLVDWNLQSPPVSSGSNAYTGRARLRKYLFTYSSTHRSSTLPAWTTPRASGFASVVYHISEQAGLERCQLLKIKSQMVEATTELRRRERTYRQQVGVSVVPRSNEKTLLAGDNREKLKAREEFITFSLAGFITILYAVFTPFDAANVVEMRGKLLALMNDLKEIFLHWRLGQHVQHLRDIASSRTFSLSTQLADFFCGKSHVGYILNEAIVEIFSWWCYQQNPKVFSFLYGPDFSPRAKGGFLTLLKDCIFVSALDSK